MAYKSFQSKKYYLAFHTFPDTAKNITIAQKPYNTGFRKWESDLMTTYAIVIGTFRVMFGIKKPQGGACVQG